MGTLIIFFHIRSFDRLLFDVAACSAGRYLQLRAQRSFGAWRHRWRGYVTSPATFLDEGSSNSNIITPVLFFQHSILWHWWWKQQSGRVFLTWCQTIDKVGQQKSVADSTRFILDDQIGQLVVYIGRQISIRYNGDCLQRALIIYFRTLFILVFQGAVFFSFMDVENN